MLLVVMIGIVTAQEPNIFSAEMANGRLWVAMDTPTKTVYLTGLRDWMVFASFESGDQRKYLDEKWAAHFNVGDYVKEMDLLYREGENVRIPLPFGVAYCTVKLKGNLTKEELEQRLIGIRRMTASLK